MNWNKAESCQAKRQRKQNDKKTPQLELMALQRGARIGRTMSYANYGLLVGTAMLVLISAHVKSAKLHEQPTDTVSMDHVAVDKLNEDLAAPLPYQQPQQQPEQHGTPGHGTRLHKRVHKQPKQAHNHRRAYHSKYSIEQLLHMHVTPKVSNDIDMDPCKAGEYYRWIDPTMLMVACFTHFPIVAESGFSANSIPKPAVAKLGVLSLYGMRTNLLSPYIVFSMAKSEKSCKLNSGTHTQRESLSTR